MQTVLKTEGVSKKYKNTLALDKVNMNISAGDIYGFVGENGSGKTTLIRLITGLAFADEGKIELFGVSSDSPEIVKKRKKIGAVVETPSIYLNLSARDNLKIQGELIGEQSEEKIKQALETVGLASLYNEKKHAGDFSLGMRQRLGIAMALLGEPEFIILDEPMNGLDPAGIVEIRELILKLNKENGITFLISSHILSELELVATKYGIISKGALIKEITSEQLHAECKKTTSICAKDVDVLIKTVTDLGYDFEVIKDGIKVLGEMDLNEFLKRAIAKDAQILSVNCQEMSLEEYYLALVGGAR